MAGVACLAAQKGYQVVGYDLSFEPPMSDVLQNQHIILNKGYPKSIDLNEDDMIIVGNQLKRSEPLIQFLIQSRVKLFSAPEWLMAFILRERKVIAVTGCHGKTTITSMVAWILQKSGVSPGYLIGGVHQGLGGCAHLGEGEYFVIEADEYDAAFFDKRPKFLHYWPQYLIISGLEYDHADIYDSLEAILLQFKYLLRLLPQNGLVISHDIPMAISDQVTAFNLKHYRYASSSKKADYTLKDLGEDVLSSLGSFNQLNALAAMILCRNIGISKAHIQNALLDYECVARRQSLMYKGSISAYDDFAHHPSAVRWMLKGLAPSGRIHAIYHPATYTQRCGKMDREANAALDVADFVYILMPKKNNIDQSLYSNETLFYDQSTDLAETLKTNLKAGDQVVVMSAYYLADLWSMLIKALSEIDGKEMECV